MQFLLTSSFDAYIVLTCTEADVNIHVPPISISSAVIFLYYFTLIPEEMLGGKIYLINIC